MPTSISRFGKLATPLLLVTAFLILGNGVLPLSGQDGEPEKTIFIQEFVLKEASPSGSCSGNEVIAAPPGLPVINDFVELRRSSCYGRCPAYTVQVRADGKVTWNGRAFVGKVGEDSATILPDQARALIEKFRTSEVWSLCSDYSRAVTDSVTVTTRMHIGNQEKVVSDYAGSAPRWFNDLRDQIDSVANTRRWTERDPRTEVFALVPARDSAGEVPDERTLPVISLRDAIGNRTSITPLMRASARGDLGSVENLIAGKADVNARDAGSWTALMYAAGSEGKDGNSILQKLLEAGADPRTRTAMGQSAMMAAAASFYEVKERLRLLQQAGGDINIQDANGQTALMFAARFILGSYIPDSNFRERTEVLSFMRAAGARADIRDKTGLTVFDQIEGQARDLVGAGKQYDLVAQILRDLIPGDFPPVSIRGRVVTAQPEGVAVSAVTIDRVGKGFEPAESAISADGMFEFSSLKQGVYRLQLKPSSTINPPEVAVSVRNTDLSNIEFVNPGMHEIIVRVFVEKDLPLPALGLIIENSTIGPVVGKPPEIDIDNNRPLPANIRSAIAAHGSSANIRILELKSGELGKLAMRVFLPRPFDELDVPTPERLPDGTFRIVLPVGEYHVGAVIPDSKSPFVVESITSGSTDLLTRPLEIPKSDLKEIQIRLKRG